MFYFFMTIWLITGIGFLIGLIQWLRYKSTKRNTANVKKVSLICIMTSLASLIVALIINASIPINTPIANLDEDNSVLTESTTPKTLEDKITDTINKTIKGKTNVGKDRVAEVELKEVAIGKRIKLTLNSDDNVTLKAVTSVNISNTNAVFKELFDSYDFAVISIHWLYPMKDNSGNVEDTAVLRIELTRETYEVINWEVFDGSTYADIADYFHLHPSFN